MSTKTTLTPEDIKRTLARIAHEIIERNKGIEKLILVGMRPRGAPLAKRLAEKIEGLTGQKIPVGTLDPSPYRDGSSSINQRPVIKHTDIPVSVDDKAIVLVDDVLYTGRSIRAAMDALTDLGRPRLIQLAILIDRGHREMPIRADYVGKNIPSAKDEEIQVRLAEIDGSDEVVIVKVEKEQSPITS